MKIIRFVTDPSAPQYGSWEEDGSARLIEGDLFGEWSLSDQQVSKKEIQKILAPVDPPNLFAIGLNYKAHADESNMPYPDAPLIFLKATTSVIAPGDPVMIPPNAPDEVDYEVELALVIGKEARNVSESDAMDYLFGYTALNDVSARDCQMKFDKQWTRAKSFDTFAPMGPCIQTEGDPDQVQVRTRLNGEVMQDSNSSDMIFSSRALISYLSHQFTLLPGTVIATGTPQGIGWARKPQVFMKDGDTIEIEVEGVGILSNPIRAA